MVNTSSGSGKYLMKKWHEDRAKALKDQRSFTDEELAWLEVTNEPVIGEDYPELLKVPVDHIDPLATDQGKKIDLREDPRYS